MADVSMDYTSMASMQSQVQGKLDKLEDMLDTMDRLVDGAKKNWRGHGHKKFTDSFSKVEADLRTVCECLEKYVTAIKQAQADMETVDSESAKSTKNVAIVGGVGAKGGGGSGGVGVAGLGITGAAAASASVLVGATGNFSSGGGGGGAGGGGGRIPADGAAAIATSASSLGGGSGSFGGGGSMGGRGAETGKSSDRGWDLLETVLETAGVDGTKSSAIVKTIQTVYDPDGTTTKLYDKMIAYQQEAVGAFLDGDIGEGLRLSAKSIGTGLGAIGYGVGEVFTEMASDAVGGILDKATLPVKFVGQMIPGKTGEAICRFGQKLDAGLDKIPEKISALL